MIKEYSNFFKPDKNLMLFRPPQTLEEIINLVWEHKSVFYTLVQLTVSPCAPLGPTTPCGPGFP